jgi:hypothetical protein
MTAALKAEIEHMRAQAADLARNAEMLSRRLDALADMEDSVEPIGPRWISLKRAAKIFGYHPDTLRRWAVIYKLGHKLPGGRSAPWVVDEIAVREHLARREPIPS